MAEDYFAAMQRVEQRLEIALAPQETASQEPERQEILVLVDQLEQPEICVQDRLGLVAQLRKLLISSIPKENSPPKEEYELVKVRCFNAQTNGARVSFASATCCDNPSTILLESRVP